MGIAASIGDHVTGLAVDVSEPMTIADSRASTEQGHGLVLAAIGRDANFAHTLLDRVEPTIDTGIALFRG